jgi:hypothetical protein
MGAGERRWRPGGARARSHPARSAVAPPSHASAPVHRVRLAGQRSDSDARTRDASGAAAGRPAAPPPPPRCPGLHRHVQDCTRTREFGRRCTVRGRGSRGGVRAAALPSASGLRVGYRPIPPPAVAPLSESRTPSGAASPRAAHSESDSAPVGGAHALRRLHWRSGGGCRRRSRDAGTVREVGLQAGSASDGRRRLRHRAVGFAAMTRKPGFGDLGSGATSESRLPSQVALARVAGRVAGRPGSRRGIRVANGPVRVGDASVRDSDATRM